MKVTITGLAGDFCSPKCSTAKPCPTDVPAGTTAKGQCVLEMSGQPQPSQCALICAGADGKPNNLACPAKATCKPISTTAVCTYDSLDEENASWNGSASILLQLALGK